MRKLIPTILLVILITVSVFGQKCNVETIKILRDEKENLTDSLILNFLTSIDNSCGNNIEWSEASNRTLFWLADIETGKFIDLLKSNKTKIDIQQIINDFKQPINDSIDLNAIHKKITDLKDKDEVVVMILSSIESAAIGLNIEIKR